VLAIFAHPDDETLCAGGTLAKYASTGADVRVVSLTRGGAGQIRDAGAATRATLAAAREREFHAAGKELGLTETRCLDYPDGELPHVDPQVLVELASRLLDELDPDVVITFGPAGFSGHPDHVAVGAAVSAACYARQSSSPVRLFHCHRPQSRMLLRDRLAAWVVEMTTRFEGTNDFVHAMSVFSRETSALGYAADFVNVEWFPSRTYLIEQGEAATTMYLILSGHVEIRREDENGDVSVLNVLGAGQFVGEEGQTLSSCHQDADVAVDEDVRNLMRSQQRIHGNEDTTCSRGSEDRGDCLNPLVEEDSHSVPSNKAEVDQARSHRLDLTPQLRVVESRRFQRQGRSASLPISHLLDQVVQICPHGVGTFRSRPRHQATQVSSL